MRTWPVISLQHNDCIGILPKSAIKRILIKNSTFFSWEKLFAFVNKCETTRDNSPTFPSNTFSLRFFHPQFSTSFQSTGREFSQRKKISLISNISSFSLICAKTSRRIGQRVKDVYRKKGDFFLWNKVVILTTVIVSKRLVS